MTEALFSARSGPSKKIGASEGIRTLDIHLGKVTLYQTELRSLPCLKAVVKVMERPPIASPVLQRKTKGAVIALPMFNSGPSRVANLPRSTLWSAALTGEHAGRKPSWPAAESRNISWAIGAAVAQLLYTETVGGSNPSSPTTLKL
jgi:hypothetical protein